jgi:hypothetical protein
LVIWSKVEAWRLLVFPFFSSLKWCCICLQIFRLGAWHWCNHLVPELMLVLGKRISAVRDWGCFERLKWLTLPFKCLSRPSINRMGIGLQMPVQFALAIIKPPVKF